MPRERQKVDFVHLHNHSEYSLLDGATRIEDMVQLAKEMGMEAVALTDHGGMFGVIKFYQTAQRAGVKPIIGAEVYIAPRHRQEKEHHIDVPEASFHLTLLCANETGYRNLIKLVSLGYLEGFYYKPRVDKELLAKYHSGLIALSGCLKGEVNWYLLRQDIDSAMRAAASYQEIFGRENFYLEVMRTGLPEQEKIIPDIVDISRALDIPIVATNDCHYLKPEDARAQDVLVCLQTNKRLKDKERLRLAGNGFYFRSGTEMLELFKDLPEAVSNTRAVAEKCECVLKLENRQFHLPAFKPPAEFEDEFRYLTHLVNEGVRQRYRTPTPEIEDRLKYELEVINRMGFAGYFLIVHDIVHFAKMKGIRVGPGRGSAGGSLVLYCLGVTEIDPLKYGLLFERFLNSERITLPDVDIDFADSRRQEVIDYIRSRYGEDSVTQIITFGTLGSRAVIRDVGRVLDIPIAEVDPIAKQIPPGSELATALKEVPELQFLIRSKPEYQQMWEIALKLEGLCRHASVHASAVVITPRPLLELIPLYKVPGGETCTQYDMYTLDDIGILKMDILGLRTLTVIDEAEKLIQQHTPGFRIENLDYSDRRTYELLQQGETVGLFQLESAGMRDLCKRSRPEKLEHIIDLIALFRPGPMDLIPEYIERKKEPTKIKYDHPDLEDFCKDTYGIIIYQEQVMQAAQALAGYTLGQADILRRAMGKKKPAEMAAQRETFIAGCEKKKGLPRERAQAIFDLLEKFAGYGFNKSHATGYACLSYITAYLKANYPKEFIAASLTSELGDTDKLAKFISEARRMGIKVLGPDINHSAAQFTIEKDAVRYGLAGVKNVGINAAEIIVAERQEKGPYENLLDFLVRTRGKVNRKAVESLIKAGAFDSFNPNRTQLLAELEPLMTKAASEKLLLYERQFQLFGPAQEESNPPLETEKTTPTADIITYEKDSFGFYFSSHPLEHYRLEYNALALTPIAELENLEEGKPVAIGGIISSRKVRKDRRERDYFILTIEDFNSAIEVMVFNNVLETCRELLKPDSMVIVQGKVKMRAGGDNSTTGGIPQLWADSIYPFDRAYEFIRKIVLELFETELDDSLIAKIRETLSAFPGETPVVLHLTKSDNEKRRLLLKKYPVRLEPKLIAALTSIVGPDRVKLIGNLPQLETRDYPGTGKKRR